MKISGILIILSTLIYPTALPSLDLSQWISSTDRGSNDVIIQFLSASDFGTSIQAIKALGLRKDSYVEDIIANLISSYSHKNFYEKEYLLRILLDSVFPFELKRSEQTERLKINKEAVNMLAGNLYRFQDFQLKSEILRLLALSNHEEHQTALLAEGKNIVKLLIGQSGQVYPGQADLLLSYLEAAKASGNQDFIEPCLSIYELTGDSAVADRAGEVVQYLLSF